jgi:hypothetical protein
MRLLSAPGVFLVFCLSSLSHYFFACYNMERTTNHQVSHGGELRGTYKTLRRLQGEMDNIFVEDTAGNTPFSYGTEEITSLLPDVGIAALFRLPSVDGGDMSPFVVVGNDNTPFPYGTEEIGDPPAGDGDVPPLRIPIPDPDVTNPFPGVGNDNTPFPYGTEEIGDPPAVYGDVPPLRIPSDGGN